MKTDKTTLRFMLIAGAAFAILTAAFEASRGTAFERLVVEDLILAPTHRIIDLVCPNDHVTLVGRTFVSGAARMTVTRGCEGVEMFLMLSAAMLAWPASLRARLSGLLIGFLLAFGLSIARLAILVFVLNNSPTAWELLHGLVLPLVPVLLMAWYFFRWSTPRAAVPASPPNHAV